ncbi:L,D-transpeptidase family protein [Shewanella gelidii]|uniref:L,D-TPase catalytic domain-containing protein n=1 Tax=Shewanella gelidii TaxID=1642821 RepID=A0A917JSU7_9GAMM|nr:L,D-transpeptidase family protein [Shewanella gelidii]MCL1097928.1 L,D-transpeptidase family protein [Shewanella gelidii]GGI84777.1 hypothetical protein GCM10009332_22600 [Shewanella gelidii]
MTNRVLVILFALILSCPALANEQQARQTLMRQLQLLALVDDDQFNFEQQQAQLSQAPDTEWRSLSVNIAFDIERFWSRRGVPISNENKFTDNEDENFAIASEPNVEGYLATTNHIAKLLWMQQKNSWLPIEVNRLLRLGDTHPQLNVLIKRLWLLGDLAQLPVEPSKITLPVHQALMRFQRRHGLKVDGVVGPMTLKWLNTTPFQKAKLLANNFVESATYRTSIGSRYLLVNIPAFEMVLVDDNEEQLRSRVIVGKPYRPTPILNSQISNIVLNPPWRVPRRIIYRDLLPHIRKDGTYIEKRQFQVFDYQGNLQDKGAEEWQSLALGKFPYRLVQKPGSLNALGRYKFHFANRHSVYLHDTPNPELFNEANRALSSGCIRVESVTALANWMASNLVKDKQTWVDLQSTNQTTQWFSLKSNLPVHLVYWTAWVDEVNQPQFRNDIYNLAEKRLNTQNVTLNKLALTH